MDLAEWIIDENCLLYFSFEGLSDSINEQLSSMANLLLQAQQGRYTELVESKLQEGLDDLMCYGHRRY